MISVAAKSDPGRVHDLNEDSMGLDDAHRVWLVADGMGGHAAGEVASQVARDTVLAQVSSGATLTEAIGLAHAAVVQSAAEDESRKGMGTTCVAVRIEGATSEWCWVGDSRGYLWRQGVLLRVTRDHSFMQLLIDRQHITEEQARTHPKRNVVTQVLGYGDPKSDTVSLPLQTGDVLLLCSDGLVDELTDEEMAGILRAGGVDSTDLEQCVDALVTAACDKGGRDNVSAVLIRYDGPTHVEKKDEWTGAVDPNRTTVVRGRSPQSAVVTSGADSATNPAPSTSGKPRRGWMDWTIVGLATIAMGLLGILLFRYLGGMT